MQQEPTVKGVITESLPNAMFRVRLADGSLIIAMLAGKLRLNHIRVIPGDNVSLVLSPQKDKGRIVYRG